mmetsp:Transcript_56287/g.131509  ORF Transcript_56287/g.131509 Transcript_56287/m.131509 type:complete len:216 (+) Transcript_56287:447-1094(+)
MRPLCRRRKLWRFLTRCPARALTNLAMPWQSCRSAMPSNRSTRKTKRSFPERIRGAAMSPWMRERWYRTTRVSMRANHQYNLRELMIRAFMSLCVPSASRRSWIFFTPTMMNSLSIFRKAKRLPLQRLLICRRRDACERVLRIPAVGSRSSTGRQVFDLRFSRRMGLVSTSCKGRLLYRRHAITWTLMMTKSWMNFQKVRLCRSRKSPCFRRSSG